MDLLTLRYPYLPTPPRVGPHHAPLLLWAGTCLTVAESDAPRMSAPTLLSDGTKSHHLRLLLHKVTDFLSFSFFWLKKKRTFSLSSRASICLTSSQNSCHLPWGWRSKKFCSETAELQVSGSLPSAGAGSQLCGRRSQPHS